MSFYQESIVAAKMGCHWLRLSPNDKLKTYVVTRVRGETVWVAPLAIEPAKRKEHEFSLNHVASKMLIDGKYRLKAYV